MTSYAGTRTDRRDPEPRPGEYPISYTPAPERPPADLRTVTIDVDAMGSLSLGELMELGELTGMPLDELRARLRPSNGKAPDPSEVIRVALGLAVVLERRDDPTLTMADARRWDIQIVKVTADPKPRARRTRASSSRG